METKQISRAEVVLSLVREADAKKQARLLQQGANVLTLGAFEEKAQQIREKAKAAVQVQQAKVKATCASEAKAAEAAKEAAKEANATFREAAEKRCASELNAIRAAKLAGGLDVVNAARAAYNLKPLPLVITVPANAATLRGKCAD